MPELPEVEVVRKSLNNLICGLTINKVDIFNDKLRYKITKKLKKVLKNQKIISIKRRAKFLLIQFNNKKTLLIHLGMTGKIFILNRIKNKTYKTSFYYDKKFKPKHNHLGIKFNSHLDLIYNDVRKFGFIKILNTQKINLNKHLSNLGPEPLSKNFNFNYIKKVTRKCTKNIKNFLMDQKYVSGLGNIYVNEILAHSSINPRKVSYKLDDNDILKIIKNTKKTLFSSIKLGGSSIRDFNNIKGDSGKFQKSFIIYNREKQKCKKKTCGGIIKKTYISGRSTFFCKRCQN